MKTEYLIAIDEFCSNHNVEISFITSLQHSGLIEITLVEESYFIEPDQLPQLEKFTRLFYEMDINVEGIETIAHLLQRMNNMHDELTSLRNRLRFYELGE
jgi:hypothetical protein